MTQKVKNPFQIKFVPRPMLDTNSFSEYVIVCKDNNNNYHCFTNLTDPVKVAGYKEMLKVSFLNSFTESKTDVIKS
tara:strand:- start:425 stop:652 length:228 start_codon:yes stop_codon:yes gene_type:complete